MDEISTNQNDNISTKPNKWHMPIRQCKNNLEKGNKRWYRWTSEWMTQQTDRQWSPDHNDHKYNS